MVIAAVSVGSERKELKSLPGAFVILRRMTYGEKIHRQEQSMNEAVMREPKGNRAQRRNKKRETEMVMNLAQRAAQEFEFAKCIVEHNLEIKEGVLFDFTDPGALDFLDPQVGEEISSLIDDMNNFDNDEEGDDTGN